MRKCKQCGRMKPRLHRYITESGSDVAICWHCLHVRIEEHCQKAEKAEHEQK